MSSRGRDLKVILTLGLEALSPIHVGTGYGCKGFIDRITIKSTTEDKLIYIPGSSLKGRIRANFERLQKIFQHKISGHFDSPFCKKADIKDCCPICQIFGSKLHEGRFYFPDAEIESSYLSSKELREIFSKFQTEIRTGIAIARSIRTALSNYLFITEVGCYQIVYNTIIEGILTVSSSFTSVPHEVALLLASIKTLDKIGGGKSRGLGLIKANIKRIQIDSQDMTDENEINKLITSLGN